MMPPGITPDGAGDATFEYLAGQLRPGHPALVEQFVHEGDAAVAALSPVLDLCYGGHPRERFDLFAAPAPTATILYLHAGYWQGRDKAQFRFLAPAFVLAGFNVAFVNHPLCPEATICELTESVRRAARAVLDAAPTAAGLVAMGHSAGAHLAVELALTDWAARGLARNPVTAVVGLSGVYDLEPLLATKLNDKLRLDAAAARTASPVHRARGGMPPAIFAVGAEETPAFQAQNEAMCAVWRAHGNAARAITVDGADHFTLLRRLEGPGDDLFAAVMALARATGAGDGA